MSRQDKRRHPRVARRIRVRSTSREAVELETIDLSVGGLLCTAPAFLPPMMKLAVSLFLPRPRSAPDHDGQIRGEAVVVRTEPPSPGDSGYRVALFFSRMDEADRQKLQRFLANHDR